MLAWHGAYGSTLPPDGGPGVAPRATTGRLATTGSRWLQSLLGPDRPADLTRVVATFVAFVALDRVTRSLVVLEAGDLGRFSLVVAALAHRWWLTVVVIVVAVAVVLRWPRRVAVRWDELEAGRALRVLAGALVVLVIWYDALYPYNWLVDRSHWLDRALVLALGAAAVARPAFLAPFVAVSRIVAEQFVFPFDTVAGRNIGDLILIALLAVAAGHALHIVSGTKRTAPVLLVLAAAVAAHFFVPGKAKLSIGWLGGGRIADLPLASYSAGWLGQTDGGLARALFSFYDQFRWPVMVATLVLELGAVVAVTRPQLLRWWLPGSIAFHLATFATTGFWFLPWLVLEVGLLLILSAPSLRPWVAGNATPARGLVAALAVIGGSVVFHPPGLAWLDGPVSYGYRIEGIGVSGERYDLPADRLAPLSHHVAFNRLQLGPRLHATGAYGATVSHAVVDELATITTFAQLDEYEATLGRPTLEEPSTAFLSAYLADAARADRAWWERGHLLAPPEYFWTGGPEPTFRDQEPLRGLEVHLVRSIHGDGDAPLMERRAVLALAVSPEGEVVAAELGG